MTPDEYRQKHKRCATCKYFVSNYTNVYRGICDVKEQSTKRTKGRFCKTYKPISFNES